MLILGARYGSVEPKTGLSYTELEYDYAVRNNIPHFAVIMNEDEVKRRTELKSEGLDETGYAEQLLLFREKVSSKMVSFFNDTKDIKLAIHETLNEINYRNNLKGWVRGNEIVDPSPLYAQIEQERSEKEVLLQELDATRSELNSIRAKTADKVELSFNEIYSILSKIEIKTNAYSLEIPATKYSLLSLFLHHRDELVEGIRDTLQKNDWYKLLYYNVCPKLVIYGLVAKDRLKLSDSYAIDRYVITNKGLDLYAYIDKESLLPKA